MGRTDLERPVERCAPAIEKRLDWHRGRCGNRRPSCSAGYAAELRDGRPQKILKLSSARWGVPRRCRDARRENVRSGIIEKKLRDRDQLIHFVVIELRDWD